MINEIMYGFVNSNNVLINTAVFYEGDTETLERVKQEFNAENYYPINLEKETIILNETYWNGVRFLPPKHYASWTWDEEKNTWVCPVPYPDDEKLYDWHETTQSWYQVPFLEDPE